MTDPQSLPQFPPQFVKLVALWRSSTFEGERDTARRKAEALLPLEAGGWDRALRIMAYQQVRAAAPLNFLAGFDEWQEIDNPGHMARNAEKRAEARRRWEEHRKSLLERLESFEAVLEPCARERLLLAALRRWRVVSKPPHQRWTWKLKGYDGFTMLRDMPGDLRAAVEGAYPMPTTLAAAREELAYWRAREKDMEHALSEDGTGLGDTALDRVAYVRMEVVRDAVVRGIRLKSLPEIVERFAFYREQGGDDQDIEDAIFRDLCALVGREVDAASAEPAPTVLHEAGDRIVPLPETSPTAMQPWPVPKPKREPSPWPTWTKLSHQERLHWLQEVDAYHELMSKSTKVAFYTMHQKIFRRPHEVVSSTETALFNRTVKTVWLHL